MDIRRKRPFGLASFIRLLVLFVVVCVLVQSARTLYWHLSKRHTSDILRGSSNRISKSNSDVKSLYPRVNVVDRDPFTKMLEDYIFTEQADDPHDQNHELVPTSTIKHAKIINNTLIEQIPRIKIPDKIDCRDFVYNDVISIQRGKVFMKLQPKNMTFQNLETVADDCQSYIQNRGYITSAMTEEEKNFPLAYGILIYKDVEMVERLLRAIYRPQNFYCLHVDAKSDLSFYLQIQALTKCFKNVFIASRRTDVRWGTLSLLLSDLLCMRDLFKYKWKYYINLTGQEFPIRNNFELVQVLKTFRGSNDLESTYQQRNNERYESVFDADGIPTGYQLPPVPLNITVVKGNMHGAMSRGFIDFILNNKKSKTFFDWVKHTGMPEETYFATINSNPHLGAPGSFTGGNLERHNLWSREIHWYRDCGGKFVRGVCVNGLADLQRLTKSKRLFLNKFHLDFEYLAFDCFEQWFYDQTRLTYSGRNYDVSMFAKLDIVKYGLRH